MAEKILVRTEAFLRGWCDRLANRPNQNPGKTLQDRKDWVRGWGKADWLAYHSPIVEDEGDDTFFQ